MSTANRTEVIDDRDTQDDWCRRAFGRLPAGLDPLNGQGTVEVCYRYRGGQDRLGAATAPVTITIDRKMSQVEADKLGEAFKAGGAAALRKALAGVPPTGTIRLGSGNPTPTRVTVERVTDTGRLLTIVTDQALFFVGAGAPGAKPQAGFDFAVVDV
jgi:hypothetical protein